MAAGLAAGLDPDPQRGARQLPVQRGDALGDLSDHHVVVVADVRGGADTPDSVLGGLGGHRDRVVEVDRPIVEAREYVAVDVDHALGSRWLDVESHPDGGRPASVLGCGVAVEIPQRLRAPGGQPPAGGA